MDIFEWVFKKRPRRKQLPEISSLKSSIRTEMRLFHRLWASHEKKKSLVSDASKGKVSKVKKITKANREILDSSEDILRLDNIAETLIKKILYESLERLHEIESWIWRYGATANMDRTQFKGKRMPYNIEHLKQSVWPIVKDEERLLGFVKDSAARLKSDFKALMEAFAVVKETIEEQTRQLQRISANDSEAIKILENLMEKEDRALLGVRKTLADIANKVVLSAKAFTQIDIDEQKTIESIKANHKAGKRAGVLLIHAMVSKYSDMEEFAKVLRSQGFIVYNLRMPGHNGSMEEFFNTSFGEIESFLVSAFKYFYQYMNKINQSWDEKRGKAVPDGRFYVAGVSLGSMMALHVLAKRWGETYPYQAMVKGIVTISIGTILRPLSIAGKGEPYIYNALLLGSKPIIDSIIGITLRKKGENKEFESIKKDWSGGMISESDARSRIRTVVLKSIEKVNKKFSAKGQSIASSEEEKGQIVEEIVGLVLRNMISGKKPLIDTGNIYDLKARLTRDSMPGHSFRAKHALGVLSIQLREDTKHIKIPILVMPGLHDTFVDPKGAEYIYENVQTPKKYKKLVWLKKSGHIPVVDYDKEKVFSETIDFIRNIEAGEVKAADKKAA